MTVEAVRIENFMCFEDSGWVELRPITLFYGRNSAGKSALLRSLLLLRQSVTSQPDESALIFVLDDALGRRERLDFGSYYDLVRDHECERLMSFSFKCSLVDKSEVAPDVAAILSGLGIKATVKVRLSYGLLPHNEQLALFAIALYDDASSDENPIWQASAPLDASSDQPWDFTTKQGANIWRVAALTVEQGFFPKLHEEEENSGETAMSEFHHIQQLLHHLEHAITSFLKSLEYLGPSRAQPQRFYYVPKQGGRIGSSAQNIVRTLVKTARHENLGLDRINEWLAKSAFEVHLELKALDQNKTLYQLLLSDTPNGRKRAFQSNIRDVSFGISQVLPVVVEALLASEHKTLLLEQPELHLHPGAQVQLGNLFVKMARQGVRFLIETHSEHLLIRLRRWIAETSVGQKTIGSHDEYLNEEELAVHFINRDNGVSTAARIEIGTYGQLLNSPPGFQGFFADDLRETAALSRARLVARKAFRQK